MGEGEHEEGRTGHPGASGEGRYGGPPFRLESTYSIMGTCYRCEGEVQDLRARVATLETEREAQRIQIVCCNHEFAAIAKALGLGRSITAGDVADAVAEVLVRIAAVEALLTRLGGPGPDRGSLAERVAAAVARAWAEAAEHRVLAERAKVADLQASIATLEAERRWIPVGERLPVEDSRVLAWDRATGSRSMFYHCGVFYPGSGGVVTHWRPLDTGPGGE